MTEGLECLTRYSHMYTVRLGAFSVHWPYQRKGDVIEASILYISHDNVIFSRLGTTPSFGMLPDSVDENPIHVLGGVVKRAVDPMDPLVYSVYGRG